MEYMACLTQSMEDNRRRYSLRKTKGEALKEVVVSNTRLLDSGLFIVKIVEVVMLRCVSLRWLVF